MKLILFVLLTIGTMFFFLSSPKKHYRFSKETISARLPFQEGWEGRPQTSEEKKQTEAALAQSYRFLGGGGQCFSFLSQDGKFVIKFFKQKAFHLTRWMKICPLPYFKEKKMQKIKAKRERVFSAFKLSFDRLPEETGIFYIHLNFTEDLHTTLAFCDFNGKEHRLNLDKLQFVIQKKADLADHHLEDLMAKKDYDGAKQAISQLLALYLNLHRKGVHNRDPNFRDNYGFAGARAMLIDVGKVTLKEAELYRFTKKFRIYLANRCPELVDYFDESVTNIECKN